jgi:glycerol-3-phosphate cytidylyltransferase
MVIGYTAGVFDLFHVGHVNLLRNAKAMCDRLIVGVTIDDLVAYKSKKAVIPFDERIEIVRSCRYVDLAVPQTTMDKFDAHRRYGFNIMFVGDDWYKTEKWIQLDRQFMEVGVKIMYFPYTHSTSSTLINGVLNDLRSGMAPEVPLAVDASGVTNPLESGSSKSHLNGS